MLFALTKRILTEAQPKVVAKFVYNFGVKGIRCSDKRDVPKVVDQMLSHDGPVAIAVAAADG